MRRTLVAAVVAVSVVAGGCAERTPGGTSVVVGFAPIAEIASRIGGGYVHVTNVTPPGAEPHEIEPTPAHVEALLDAKLVVLLGGGFQPAVEKLAAKRRRGETLLLLPALGVRRRRADPHVWLDPIRMRTMTDRVLEALVRADRRHASRYRANASMYKAELESLADEMRRGLASCERRTIVTSHAAFGYLAKRYKLEQHAITGISPEAEPDPSTVAGIADLVRNQHLTTIFMETLVSPRVAEALARETGVKTAVLDPVEGFAKPGDTYIRAMGQNLVALREALRCS